MAKKRSWWDKLWGSPEKINEQQAKYTGPLPYSSQTEFPVGKSLNDVILQGLTGENWGFPKGYIERSTSPFVAQLQADWPDTQREIQDVYSARGLGRSTPVARDIGKAASQRDRDINQILSQAYQADIAQRKQDEANAIARGQTYSGQEVATRGGAGQFGLNQLQVENAANMQNNELRRQYASDETSALNRMIYAPLAIGASVATGNPMIALSAFGGGGGSGNFDMAKYALEDLLLQKQNRAKAFTKDYDDTAYKQWPTSLR